MSMEKIVMKNTKKYEESTAKFSVCSTSNMIHQDSVNLRELITTMDVLNFEVLL
jgi:hypothetical protein